MKTLAAIATLFYASMVASQSPTIDVFLPAVDSTVPLAASIVDVHGAATTMVVNCVDGARKCGQDHGFLGGATVTQAPSTWNLRYSAADKDLTYSLTEGCKLDAENNSAECTVSYSDVAGGKTESDAHPFDDVYSTNVLPAVVTAGADKLGPITTKTSIPTKPTETSQGQKGTTKETGKVEPTSTTGKNAGPMVTGNSVLAGLAAVGAMML